jgi:hypothetical protein
VHINLYAREASWNPARDHLADLIRSEFAVAPRQRQVMDSTVPVPA